MTIFGQESRHNYSKIWNLRVQKNLNIEKITFKVFQMKFLAMHITNQKLNIFTIGNWQNIYNFDPYNVLLTIATNIPVLLMTGFVVQGHMCARPRQCNSQGWVQDHMFMVLVYHGLRSMWTRSWLWCLIFDLDSLEWVSLDYNTVFWRKWLANQTL